ncbi:Hypothetical protein SCF082_LOCUS52541 [Durusdinium trenchii]|uniref:Uncharacterized protein n=1 Tax=Durusdinium trenchii TaxID=1381693 RepID=A0ABP0SLV4_9DINO
MLLEETEIKTVAENPVFKNRNEQIGSFGRFNLQYRKEGVEETEDTEEKQHPHPGVLEARPDDVHVLCRHSAGRISTPPGAMSVVFKRIPIGGSAAVFKARPGSKDLSSFARPTQRRRFPIAGDEGEVTFDAQRDVGADEVVAEIDRQNPVEEALVAAKTKVTFLEVETVKGLPVKKDVTTKTIDPYFAAYIKDVSKAFFGK